METDLDVPVLEQRWVLMPAAAVDPMTLLAGAWGWAVLDTRVAGHGRVELLVERLG